MRKSFFLSVLLISLLFNLSAGSIPPTPSDCGAVECNYLPMIRHDVPVSVYEVSSYSNRASECWYIGDVITTSPAYNVVVELRFVGPEGDLNYSNSTMFYATLPGQLNPFTINTRIPIDHSCSGFVARVISWEVGYDRVYRNAKIVSITPNVAPSGGTNITVEIRNDELKPLLEVVGVVWSVDIPEVPDIKPIAASLAPGETATFSSLLDGTIPTFHVSAQGYLQP